MPLVSVTRLRLRSPLFLPGFARHAWASTRQVRSAPGLLQGLVATEGLLGFWTVTAWEDEAAMRRYRATAAHLRAMPKLAGWCDEASVAHWSQADAVLPDTAEALRRMAREGRLSKVHRPSPDHVAGRITLEGRTLRPGARFGPATGRRVEPGPAWEAGPDRASED